MRLNQTSMLIQREGVYYGQCSELCGVHHGFMPIVVEAVSLEKYLAWLSEQLDNSPLKLQALRV
jgi:cytochrome c oxidase subunit 2